MIKEIVLPDLGEGIESATISEIPLSAGEYVKKDDVLLVLESDKASMEIPSDYDGKVVEVLIEEGKDVVTGEPLFKIETQDGPKEKVEEEPKKEVEIKEQTEVKVQSKPVLEPDIARVGDDVFASPGVRRLARELGIDLGLIKGTGAKGRTTKEDLHSYIRIKMLEGSGLSRSSKKPIDFSQWGDIEYQKLTKINKITGSRLQEAWQDIPHVTQYNSADITDLNEYRKKLKSEAEKKGIKITFLPFLMKASVLVLKEMIRFNSSLDEKEENLIIKKYFHLGVAVDTPSGLMVPCVRDVDKKTITELSKELVDISQRARDKKLRPDELRGSTFTISSLGGIGGTAFAPIVNPPDVAILGVSKSEWKPVFDKKTKEFIPRFIMPFSLSYDHRVIDGASGATFVERLSQTLENIDQFKE
ncbi:MAG: branched-chain alpha-keto acid dehydrogenase subunit E2 [Candidatus Marinimicrobia bacterium]|nr:branched-chain alpha-keto acid dehydrogenase subunit E2 [Candidatus Neomarinimicrobiota bacterium]|tara:strand:+ start:336 stop:1583 length:1248 start_codon:yes stop_codon:yes gene_type:complete